MSTLQEALDKALSDGRIKPQYPRGYRKWRKSFQEAVRRHGGDVRAALEETQTTRKSAPRS